LKTTKRQTKFSLSRSGEISEIAAQLLRYLEPMPSAQHERAGAAEFAPATRGGSDAALEPIPATRSAASVLRPMPEYVAPAVWTPAEQGAAEVLNQPLLQPLRPLRAAPGIVLPTEAAQQLGDFTFAADAAEGMAAQLPTPLQRTAAPAQQTMDDISEFFRRDSRRYDRVFSGGNGA
jgi:hypothetical protein